MKLAVWRVRGFDGQRETLRFEVPAYGWTEAEAATMLQLLVARTKAYREDEYAHALAHAARGVEVAPLLVRADRGGGTVTLTCGDNPYFVAALH